MSKLNTTFKVSTILISIIDILALVYFGVSVFQAINQTTILAKSHIVLLIITIILNVIYASYLVTYLIIHKKK